jgi:hypothetical protein
MSKKCYICGDKARHEAYQPDYGVDGEYDEWDNRLMCCHCFTMDTNEKGLCAECVRDKELVNA